MHSGAAGAGCAQARRCCGLVRLIIVMLAGTTGQPHRPPATSSCQLSRQRHCRQHVTVPLLNLPLVRVAIVAAWSAGHLTTSSFNLVICMHVVIFREWNMVGNAPLLGDGNLAARHEPSGSLRPRRHVRGPSQRHVQHHPPLVHHATASKDNANNVYCVRITLRIYILAQRHFVRPGAWAARPPLSSTATGQA
jgi:hypothetical protein